MKENRWNRIVRFRMGKGMRESRYWLGKQI